MKGFPRWHSVKNPPVKARDADAGLIPGSGRSPRRKWHPLQYSCLKESTDREAWQHTVHGVTESGTTEHTAQQHQK